MRIGNLTHLHQTGFTYIGLLILVVISGIALGGVGIVWHQDAQREREKELLFIGDEFRKAIGSYYENTPADIKQFPQNLNDLLLDKRFPVVKRHLRKLYLDPMPPFKSWGLVKDNNRIIGIYSQSESKPIKKYGFPSQFESFNTTIHYKDWKFIYLPGSMPSNTGVASNQ